MFVQGVMHQDLTVAEAATAARVGPETIRRWIGSGKLRAEKTATGTYRIRPIDLSSVLRRGEVMAQPLVYRGEIQGKQQ